MLLIYYCCVSTVKWKCGRLWHCKELVDALTSTYLFIALWPFLSFLLQYFVLSLGLCFRVTRLWECYPLSLSESCLSIPQFGSSFATFRPALSHTGSIRPFSVILPASPPYSRSPGSNTSSPTSKVPCWKVCSHGHNFFADIFLFFR